MRKKVVVGSIMAALTSVCLLSGCGKKEDTSSASGKTEIHMLWNQNDDNNIQEAKYVRKHIKEVMPNVKLDIELAPGDAQTYETKIRTLLSSGSDKLDIWWERGGSFATPILEGNNALDLNSYLKKDKYYDKLNSGINIKNNKDQAFAIPFEDISYEVILYNKKIFSDLNLQTPKTVDELNQVVSTIAKSGKTPISVGAKDGWPAAMMMEGFAYSLNPNITKEIVNKKAKFTDEPYKEAAAVVQKLSNEGAFSKNVALTGMDEALPMFNSGKAAMMINGSWQVAASAKSMGDDFGYFYFPVIKSSDVDKYGKNVAGGIKENAGIMVNSATKNKSVATKTAIAVSELRNKYAYETNKNPFIVYDPAKLNWKINNDLPEPVAQLAKDMKTFNSPYGLIQDVMPTAASTSAVMQASSRFMTNSSSYGISDYLSDMNKAAIAK